MPTRLTTYLSFRDNAKEAMEFYRSVFGGDLTFSTYEEFHVSEDPSEKDKIMHAQLISPSGLVMMGADTPNSMELAVGSNFAVSISGEDEDEIRGYFDRLSEGATPGVPLEKAPWGDSFGMLTDRFGVPWMVNITGTPA